MVNGSRTDIFLSEIHNELCSEMAARCKELDIMNINIASALNRDSSNKPTTNKQIIQDSSNEETLVKSTYYQQTVSTENDNENINEPINDNEYKDCELCSA